MQMPGFLVLTLSPGKAPSQPPGVVFLGYSLTEEGLFGVQGGVAV